MRWNPQFLHIFACRKYWLMPTSSAESTSFRTSTTLLLPFMAPRYHRVARGTRFHEEIALGDLLLAAGFEVGLDLGPTRAAVGAGAVTPPRDLLQREGAATDRVHDLFFGHAPADAENHHFG